MKIGIMADIHDNVDNLRHAIGRFNAEGCRLILLAGDLVSPLVVPSMRKLTGHVIACFGDNDGNKRGIAGGTKIVGTLAHGPVCLSACADCAMPTPVSLTCTVSRSSSTSTSTTRLHILRGKLDGVANQVCNYLTKTCCISRNRLRNPVAD